MEQKKNVLTAIIALIALAVGVFVGMNLQGSGLQGKLSLNTEKGYKQCEEYKSLYAQGIITETLGAEKAGGVMAGCAKHYPSFWNASPTLQECGGLKARMDVYGPAKFSDFVKKQKITASNIIFCAYNFPFLWYGAETSTFECYEYMYFTGDGGKGKGSFGNLTKLLGNSSEKAATVMEQCYQKMGWPPAPVYVNSDICLEYKQYFQQGVLSDMISNGEASWPIAAACSDLYPLIWSGVTKDQCDQFKSWQQQGILTPQMGGSEKASDAIVACNFYGYSLFN